MEKCSGVLTDRKIGHEAEGTYQRLVRPALVHGAQRHWQQRNAKKGDWMEWFGCTAMDVWSHEER